MLRSCYAFTLGEWQKPWKCFSRCCFYSNEGSGVALFWFSFEHYSPSCRPQGRATTASQGQHGNLHLRRHKRRHLRARINRDRSSLHCVLREHVSPCSFPMWSRRGIVLTALPQGQRFTMPASEISSLTSRALNLPVVRILTCICFSFSRMGIYTKLGPGPFRCLQK